MPFTIPLAVKLGIVGLVYLIHHFKRRKLKGLILAGLIFLAIPVGTPDDWIAWALIIPSFGIVGVVSYYLLLWIVIFLIWRYM